MISVRVFYINGDLCVFCSECKTETDIPAFVNKEYGEFYAHSLISNLALVMEKHSECKRGGNNKAKRRSKGVQQ
jgi:hypothetical protein